MPNGRCRPNLGSRRFFTTKLMTSLPLLLEPLADRSLSVSAIALYIDPKDENGILSLANQEAFLALTSAFPCLITRDRTDQFSLAAQAQLQNAGCRVVESSAIASREKLDLTSIPAQTQWISGRWYLARATNTTSNHTASRTLELKLLQLVANDADTREIEAVFRQDPVLSYNLLRLVNSIGVGTARNISSFSQAILILGRQQLKRWLNLMLFSANRSDERSAMLLARVTARARTMELLSKASGLDRLAQEQAFMAGMFSLLGALFAAPLEKVLAPLNLSKALTKALLDHEGDIGKMLCALDAAEALDTTLLSTYLASISVNTFDFNLITVEAHHWMLGVLHNRQNDGND